MKFLIAKCRAPGLHITDDDIVYSPNKYRETEGINANTCRFHRR